MPGREHTMNNKRHKHGGDIYSEACTLDYSANINPLGPPSSVIEAVYRSMEQIVNYVKPELIVVAIALYFVGMALKQAQAVKDKYIPLILGVISIAICAIYVTATCTCNTGQDIAMAIFTAITQGILVAGLSTYVNQIIKQTNKDE